MDKIKSIEDEVRTPRRLSRAALSRIAARGRCASAWRGEPARLPPWALRCERR
jgi:hypothetical protein